MITTIGTGRRYSVEHNQRAYQLGEEVGEDFVAGSGLPAGRVAESSRFRTSVERDEIDHGERPG
jgi:hypothetical protein